MGPVEVLVIGFPGSQFNGEILPALTDLVERNVITVVDGLLAHRAEDGTVDVIEFEDAGASPEVDALAALIHEARDLVSEEDVDELVASLEPGSSAAVLVPGRGEYGNTCTLVMPACPTASSVRSNAASPSVGKPTITSVVRLKSRSGSSFARKSPTR